MENEWQAGSFIATAMRLAAPTTNTVLTEIIEANPMEHASILVRVAQRVQAIRNLRKTKVSQAWKAG